MNLKTTINIVSFIAAIVTLFIGVNMADPPLTAAIVGILAFAVSPYIYLMIMTKFVSRHTPTVAVLILTIITALFGISALVDSQYINPDAQGGMAFFVIPIYQWGVLLVATLLIFLLSKFKNT